MNYKFIMFILCTALGLFTLLSSAPAATLKNEQEVCARALSRSQYAASMAFAKGDQAVHSLRPEQGSIEQKYPGTINYFLQLRRRYIGARRRLRELSLAEAARLQNLLDKDLNPALAKAQDPRLIQILTQLKGEIQDSYGPNSTKTVLNPKKFSRWDNAVQSSLWDVAIACLLAGDEIYLHPQIDKLYAEKIAFLEAQTQPPPKSLFQRELDLAILRGGHWHWFEIKNWNLETSQSPENIRKLSQQGPAQNQARNWIDPLISTTLILKYPLPSWTHEEIKAITGYDQVIEVLSSETENSK